MDLHFSNRENPLKIVKHMDRFFAVLRQELLFFWFLREDRKLNEKQLNILGGAMLRTLNQLPIESKMNYKHAQSSMEKMPEFLFFQKLLILQREFMEMDYRDFVSVLGDKVSGSKLRQTE